MPNRSTSYEKGAVSKPLPVGSHRPEHHYVQEPDSQDDHHSTYATGATPVSADSKIYYSFDHHHVAANQGISSSSTPLTDESLTRNNRRHDNADKAVINLKEERGLFEQRVEELKATLQGLNVVLPECTIVKMAEREDGMIPIERFMADPDYPFAPRAMPERQHLQDNQIKQAPEGWEQLSTVSVVVSWPEYQQG